MTKREPMRTPWYHGWNILGVCVLVQIASLGVPANCMTFFLEDWSREFDMPIYQLVIAIPLFSITCAVLSPIVGIMAARFSARALLTAAALAVVVSHVSIGFAAAGWQILAIYALILPVSASLSGGIPTQTLVSRWFVRRRGLAFSICAMGLVLAGVAFPPLVVHLIETTGWRNTWWIFGLAILLIVLPAVRLVIRERPLAHDGQHYVSDEPAASGEASLTFRQIFARRNFWITLAVFVPVLLPNSALQMNFAPFVAAQGLEPQQVALLLGAFNAAAAFGKLLAGSLSDRWGNRIPLFLMAVLSTGATFWLIVAQDHLSLLFAFAALGMSQGVWVLLASCTAAEFGSAGFPRAYGVASAFAVLTTMSPPIFAWIDQRTGSYSMALILFGGISLIGVVAALFFNDRRRPYAPGALPQT